MLNVGIGKMRTLVEGPRANSDAFRSDGQTGTSVVDFRPTLDSKLMSTSELAIVELVSALVGRMPTQSQLTVVPARESVKHLIIHRRHS